MSKKSDVKDKPEAHAREIVFKKTPILVHIIVFLLITTAAAGAGLGASMFLKTTDLAMGTQAPDEGVESKPDNTGHGDDTSHDKSDGEDKFANSILKAHATPLAPIFTNLATPENIWVRMELVVVAKSKMPDELLEMIHQDLFAYMRTVKLHHIEGPSGFINLKAELSDRASTRSGGAVKTVLVRTLVLE